MAINFKHLASLTIALLAFAVTGMAQVSLAKSAADSARAKNYAKIMFNAPDKSIKTPVISPAAHVGPVRNDINTYPGNNTTHPIPPILTTSQPALVGKVGDQHYISTNNDQLRVTKKQ